MPHQIPLQQQLVDAHQQIAILQNENTAVRAENQHLQELDAEAIAEEHVNLEERLADAYEAIDEREHDIRNLRQENRG